MSRAADTGLGLGAIALAAGYGAMAAAIPKSLLSDAVGPGGVPLVIAGLMGLAGAGLLLRAALAGSGDAREAPDHARAAGLLALLVVPFLSRGLNAITLGEAAAFHMGVKVQRLKYIAVVAVAGAAGASVAVSGGIGFVGIVVPHLLRIVIGPDHRYLLPASALFGGVLMLGADMLARTIVSPAELPIGIITALAGAPFFLWVLLRDRTRNGW